ncbi:DUF2165 family protein [Pseudomonas turukhanskensis]|uniref:DUF2165 family protein n=1 Tax=Pseudomonas turukhanskensis TaxID=1806536 RepID=UPI0022F30EA5|nr:DUF2165 family protein [Pseudomonas turukhanskensis]
MDTVDSVLNHRAISHPSLNYAAYSLIISVELAVGALCMAGAGWLWRRRHEPAVTLTKPSS